MTNKPVAVQLFSLREECEKDFAGTLQKVADLGFDGVEFAGYGGLSADEVKALLDKLGLKAASSHVPLADLRSDLAGVIEFQKTIGSKYVVCPYIFPDDQNEAFYVEMISFLDEAGAECRKHGLTLCYHNHDFELETLTDGRKVLDAIYEDTDADNVKAEFDIYWLTKAGERPVDWLERYKGRTPLVHLKDMTTDEEQFFAELGTGGVNLEEVMAYGDEAGVEWWVVEQDQSRKTPLESIAISMDYLKNKQVVG